MAREKWLDYEEVRRIRERLGKSREELAAMLDVTAESIKKWEQEPGADRRQCSGPVRILMLLLERSPDILKMLDTKAFQGLPSPDAVGGTPEWFAMQRLLAVIGPPYDWGRWCTIQSEENLTVEWLQDMESAELLRCSRKNERLRGATGFADEKFKISAYLRWLKETVPSYEEDVLSWPCMSPEALVGYDSP